MSSKPNELNIPDDDVILDITINIQSFVFNLFGCIDNLARIWAEENNLNLIPTQVSFSNEEIKKTLSDDFNS